MFIVEKPIKKLYIKLIRPLRDPDYTSDRGIPYWWAPEWVRDLNGNISRIIPLKKNGDIELHMVSKEGNCTYIKGRIQGAFKQWHNDRQIDYLLLGVDEEELIKPSW